MGRLFLHFECVQRQCIIPKTGADFHKFFGGLCKCISSNIQGGTKRKRQESAVGGFLNGKTKSAGQFDEVARFYFIPYSPFAPPPFACNLLEATNSQRIPLV